jgi:hypothetical protein
VGALTAYLQERFAAGCPRGWVCQREAPLVGPEAQRRLGFAPRADVLLERADGSRRIWVEFEVSRADPVANHAKFATSRFFERSDGHEAFVSMPSRHITTGRAALAAGTAMMLRALGIPAFQVPLLPNHEAASIRRLNALPLDSLRRHDPFDTAAEIDRVFQVTDALVVKGWHRIHKADNPFTVSVNIRQWNREIADPAASVRWGRRSVRYFVFDPVSGWFAPSKFSAFIPAPGSGDSTRPFLEVQEPPGGMSLALYASLGEGDPRFDGHIARVHLETGLGYSAFALDDAPHRVRDAYSSWHSARGHLVPLRRGAPPVLLVPPDAG